METTSIETISIETVSNLKKIVCLLSCHPRNMAVQLPQSLDCLRSSLAARAVGVYWRDQSGELRSLVQRPARLPLDAALREALVEPDARPDPEWGDVPEPWLSTPMKVSGTVMGRLWVVGEPGRQFSQAEREFATMAGNQLALAIENSRLYEEVQQLAARRGKLLRQVIAAQDERCRRISRELHDEISQSLAAMALDLEAAQVAGNAVREGAVERLGDMRGRILAALGEVNRIILDLRPTLLEDLGLLPALRWYASQRLESLEVSVHVQARDVGDRLLAHLETTVYRIAQEALNNVAKHADARNVWLTTRRTSKHFTLSVRDDGRGFDPSSALADVDDRMGIGLFGMKERASLVGGTVEIQSAPGKGTRVIVRIPLEMEAEHGGDSCFAC